jgi:hypothetical protein
MENLNFNYADKVKNAIAFNPNFKGICDFNILNFQKEFYQQHYRSLGSGTAIIQTPEQLNTYLACYADMHTLKLNMAFKNLFEKENLAGKSLEVIDWGCGQAFASGVLVDFVQNAKISVDLSKFILIEPSKIALERGVEHIDAIYQRIPRPKTYAINDKADADLRLNQYQNNDQIKIHLFSNILDILALDLNKVYQNVIQNFTGLNYFVCVSPINENKLNQFHSMFTNAKTIAINNEMVLTEIFRPSEMKKINYRISRKELIFKINL